MKLDIYLPLLVAFAVGLAVIPLLRQPALRIGLSDTPGGRKTHTGEVPLTGGVAIFLAFLGGAWISGASDYGYLFAGAALLTLLGAVDDLVDLNSLVKLLFQVVVALLMVVGAGLTLESLGDYPKIGELALGAWAVPFTLFAVVGLVNAMNMTDGVDGLAGGVALTIVFWLIVVALLSGQPDAQLLLLVLMAGLVAFLCFNLRHPWRPRATVFLGDSGSMVLGFVIAWFCVQLATGSSAAVSPVAIAWVVALPVMDTLSLMVRRALKRKSPFRADREHLHHIFLRADYPVNQTAGILIALSFVFGAIGVLGSLAGVPDLLLLLGLVAASVLHFVFIFRAWRTMRALKRLSGRRNALSLRVPGTRAAALVTPVCDWRRWLALLGLYLMFLFVPVSTAGMNIGLVMVLVASVLAAPEMWRDLRRMPVFWFSVALTVYLAGRGLFAMDVSAYAGDPEWRHLLRVTGLLAVPLGWWLAGARAHWLLFCLTLVVGGAVGMVMEADWAALSMGDFAEPEAWGPPSVTGFLSACALLVLVAAAISAMHRLGRGWRPVFTLAISAALITPVLIVLTATQYVTAWIGAAAGILALGVALFWQGASRQQWMGMVMGVLIMGGVAGATWGLVIAEDAPTREAVVDPLRAAALFVGGAEDEARDLHRVTADRLTLWRDASARVAEHPWFGTGDPAARSSQNAAIRGYSDLMALYPTIAVGFGLVGLGLFALTFAAFLRELLLVGQERLWPAPVVSGVLGTTVAVMVMLGLSLQIGEPASRNAIVLLTAAFAAAATHRVWIRRAEDEGTLSRP